MKGIGIWMVVIGHLKPVSYTERVIYSVHMFLFFFCSGFLGARYRERSFWSMLLGNVKRLLFPYLVWGILSQGYELLAGGQTFDQAVNRFFFIGKWVGWNAPLWFLVVLFWVELVGYWAARGNTAVRIGMMGASLAGWYLLSGMKTVLWFGIRIVPVGLFFWIFGLVIRDLYPKLLGAGVWKYAVAAALFATWLLLGVIFNSTISVYHDLYTNIWFTAAAGCAGTVLLLLLSRGLSGVPFLGNFLSVYGQNSLFILCSHHFLLKLLMHLSVTYMGENLWYQKGSMKAILIGTGMMLLYYLLIRLIRPLKRGAFSYLI